ncbi:MAG: Tripartite ATP-independent transporter, DctQ component [Rhodobacteraceae bacterium HLUCCA24]|nr:MAG: Tripartite ATP-independent transporter, DctQ component [Rhodobacteraceae bacterium HLUCCA24]
MKRVAPGLPDRLDRITQTAALIGFGGLVAMALLIFYDGAARYLGAPRISGFSDYGEVVFPMVIASCFPAGLLRQTNVTVRAAGKLGGPRMNAVLEAFAALVTLGFFAVLAWQFLRMTGQFADAGRTTRTIGIPLAPWWWITTAIMAFCVPVQAYVAWAWARAALTGGRPEHADLSHRAAEDFGST